MLLSASFINTINFMCFENNPERIQCKYYSKYVYLNLDQLFSFPTYKLTKTFYFCGLDFAVKYEKKNQIIWPTCYDNFVSVSIIYFKTISCTIFVTHK